MTKSTGVGRHPPSQRTHGQSFMNGSPTPEYRSWVGMKHRCLNANSRGYINYGGRGISVCDRWVASFENFYADMGPKLLPQDTIDRIDNNGNYEPLNCRWASRKVQSSNRRTARKITYKGEKMTAPELSEKCGVPLPRLITRLRRGWTIERATS